MSVFEGRTDHFDVKDPESTLLWELSSATAASSHTAFAEKRTCKLSRVRMACEPASVDTATIGFQLSLIDKASTYTGKCTDEHKTEKNSKEIAMCSKEMSRI